MYAVVCGRADPVTEYAPLTAMVAVAPTVPLAFTPATMTDASVVTPAVTDRASEAVIPAAYVCVAVT
jgi:hypothetical protein